MSHTHTCTHARTHAPTHTHTYTHIHTHIHTHTHKLQHSYCITSQLASTASYIAIATSWGMLASYGALYCKHEHYYRIDAITIAS